MDFLPGLPAALVIERPRVGLVLKSLDTASLVEGCSDFQWVEEGQPTYLTKRNQPLGLPIAESPKRRFPLAVKNLADAG
jgi:hypothetical protein